MKPVNETTLYALTQPGIATMLPKDLKRVFGHGTITSKIWLKSNDLAFFDTDQPLLARKLAVAEDLFVHLKTFAWQDDKRALTPKENSAPKENNWEKISKEISKISYAASLQLHKEWNNKKTKTVRVVTQGYTKDAYSRKKIHSLATLSIANHKEFNSWKLVPDDATVEIWIHITKDSIICGLRLTPDNWRRFQKKDVFHDAGLKPTIAAAMVLLSDPNEEDIVLDPMCGYGTLPLERFRYPMVKLYAFDIDEVAVANTHNNLPESEVFEIDICDTTQLKLEDTSIDTILVNPQWDKQTSNGMHIDQLYLKAITEYSRVLKKGGLLMIITPMEEMTLAAALEVNLTLQDKIKTRVRDTPVVILKLVKV